MTQCSKRRSSLVMQRQIRLPDVEGYEPAARSAILTSLAYGKTLDFNDVYTEGITKITDRDIVYAGKIGAKVKIFGSSKKDGDRISAKVAPVLIYRRTHYIA